MTGAAGDFRPTFATNDGTETVADALNGLLRGMRENLAQPPELAIATAYFNPAGFSLLKDELVAAGSVRLLLGAEPHEEPGVRPLAAGRGRRAERQAAKDVLTEHASHLAMDRDLLGFTKEADSDAKALVAWLRQSTEGGAPVAVRLFQGGFLHGKAFIVDNAMPHVMAGSANFTYAGLARNRELNLGQFDPHTVQAVRRWFEELWHQSTDYDLAALFEARWLAYEPWHVFLRMLFEAYGSEVDEEAETRVASRLGLTSFQADGVWRAKRILRKRRGVVVADEVGLGKTFIAGELIYEATILRRQKVLVIAPATLRDSTWVPFLREKNLRADVVSYEELAADAATAGRVGSALQHPDEYAMVIIDEAHAMRNAVTKRAEALRGVLRGQAPKDLVMLTATPVNNSLNDLYNLISYFAPHDAAFADAGVPSLRTYFDRAMAVSPDDLSPEHLFDVIDQVAVRRTRRFVKLHYLGDRVVIGGVEQEIRFPTPRVRRVEYDLDAAMPGLFDMLATALGVGEAEDAPSAPAALSFARYMPSRYRIAGDAEGAEAYEVQNAGLLRSAMLKRFESSSYAFKLTLEKMMLGHDSFLAALDAGLVLAGKALGEWSGSGGTETEAFLEGLDEVLADKVGRSEEYDVPALRSAVTADRELLARLHAAVKIQPWTDDPKVLALVNSMADIAAQAESEGIGPADTTNKRKVLVFSYFADTVEHLETQLRAAIEADDRLSAFRNRIAAASGPDRRGRAQVLAGFAPMTAGGVGAEDLYDLLIATDVLSEGVNLQQARHIVNFDLPWNPMRLVQRHGRIDRIGSPHAEVFLRCYFPDKQLEALLGLEERLQRKLKQAAAATGVGEVLPGFSGTDLNFTEARLEIERLRLEQANLFEDAGPSALSGEEFRRTLQRELASGQTRQAVLGLPWGAGALVRAEAGRPAGFVFCIRIADHAKPWFRFIPIDEAAAVVLDDQGLPVVTDDMLTCLSVADPGSRGSAMPTSQAIDQKILDAAYGAWEVAQRHVLAAWLFNADPANLSAAVPKPLRDAADFVRANGSFLGPKQDELVDRLEAPYAPRIQREVRAVLSLEASAPVVVGRLAELADELGLAPQVTPEPLPLIELEDVALITWMGVLPASMTVQALDQRTGGVA